MALTSLKGCKLSIKIIYGEEIVKNIDSFGVPWNRGMFNEFSALQKINNNPDSEDSI
jgi:hypothetical protein